MIGFLALLALVGYLTSFFFSGFETGAYAMSAIRFELKKVKADKSAAILASHLKNMQAVIATVLIGTNVGNYLLTAATMGLALSFFFRENSGVVQHSLIDASYFCLC